MLMEGSYLLGTDTRTPRETRSMAVMHGQLMTLHVS
jgi:hypothetical protein